MTREDLIEAIARALDPYAWESEACGAPAREYCLARARKSFAALEAASPDLAAVLRGEAVVVPRGLTPEQEDAGGRAVYLSSAFYPGEARSDWVSRGNSFRQDDARKIARQAYAAMIAAGEKEMGR